jgi:hypothetical protein
MLNTRRPDGVPFFTASLLARLFYAVYFILPFNMCSMCKPSQECRALSSLSVVLLSIQNATLAERKCSFFNNLAHRLFSRISRHQLYLLITVTNLTFDASLNRDVNFFLAHFLILIIFHGKQN